MAEYLAKLFFFQAPAGTMNCHYGLLGAGQIMLTFGLNVSPGKWLISEDHGQQQGRVYFS
jgi:hypothetical protein